MSRPVSESGVDMNTEEQTQRDRAEEIIAQLCLVSDLLTESGADGVRISERAVCGMTAVLDAAAEALKCLAFPEETVRQKVEGNI